MQVFKWELDVVDRQTVMMPFGAKILTVQIQRGRPMIWAMCDENAERAAPRHIAIYGTGNPAPQNYGEYIATFQIDGGALIFHVFEIL